MAQLPLQPMLLPVQTLAQAKKLVQFDKGPDLFWILLFDFGEDGGALGIWKEGDDFCARITLDALAIFNQQARADHLQGHG